MTQEKKFYPKYYSRTWLNTSKNRLLHLFCWTMTVSVTFLDKNIKYLKINHKNTQLILKALINNDFLGNRFQFLTWIKQNYAQPLELWRLLLLFKIYISDYLKFKSKNSRVVAKSLKYSNFLPNSIQEEIQKSK